MLRVLIVDDEPLARRRLDILLKAIPEVEVVGAAPDGIAAKRMIGALRPDVLLLDIRMPGLSGFDLLDVLPPEDAPIVIFVTAFDSFAVQAFQRAAFDYLLKPVEAPRLRAALARAREAVATRSAAERVRELEEIIGNLRTGPVPGAPRYDREVWVQERSDRLSLPVAAIDWIGAERDYVRIHTGGRSFLVRQALGALESRLDPAAFLRIHRSTLVRTERIVRLRSQAGRGSVVLQNGVELAVSRRYLGKLKALTGLPKSSLSSGRPDGVPADPV